MNKFIFLNPSLNTFYLLIYQQVTQIAKKCQSHFFLVQFNELHIIFKDGIYVQFFWLVMGGSVFFKLFDSFLLFIVM